MNKQTDAPMHTAEHVLNQAMVRRFGCGRCFSAHINRKKSKCDYRFEGAFTADDADAIQTEVNRVLASSLPVREEFMERSEAESLFDLSRLPDSANGPIRVVRVGDYDACPCSGEHVENTGRVGVFCLTTFDLLDEVLRIRFRLERP